MEFALAIIIDGVDLRLSTSKLSPPWQVYHERMIGEPCMQESTGTMFRMLIDGELIAGTKRSPVYNPASRGIVAAAPRAEVDDVHRAVAAARQAFPSWARSSVDNRATLIDSLADRLWERRSAFARLLTLEQGKPLAEADGEVAGSYYTLKAIAAMRIEARTLRETAEILVEEHYAPLGVVAGITPWNFPLIQAVSKIAPALLAGNTMVLKPAGTTPLTSLLLGEMASDIFPRGVLNVIADDNDIGSVLTDHSDIAKISFTGSSATGSKVMAAAASGLKRFTLELGGNDAAVILDDIDPVELAPKLFAGAMTNAGQVCVAIKRVYAPRKLYEPLCEELAKLARATKVGDGLVAGTTMGPVQNEAQYRKLRRLIDDTRSGGATVLGDSGNEDSGFFIEPAIVRDIGDDARLVVEEQFGPVLPILAYDELDEAISRANNSSFGLCASVWGKDVERAKAVAAQLEVGTTWVNHVLALDPGIPFRGAKQSGFGCEYGWEGLVSYTQPRVISTVAPIAAGDAGIPVS